MYVKFVLVVLAISAIAQQYECVNVDVGEGIKPISDKVACGLDKACQELFRCPDSDYFDKPARCWWNRQSEYSNEAMFETSTSKLHSRFFEQSLNKIS